MIDEVSSSVATYYSLQDGEFLLSQTESQSVGQHELRIGQYTLTIMNRFQLEGVDSLARTRGLHIQAANESKEAVTLTLQNSIQIVVNLMNEEYLGPEALVLHGPSDLIVVWNKE